MEQSETIVLFFVVLNVLKNVSLENKTNVLPCPMDHSTPHSPIINRYFIKSLPTRFLFKCLFLNHWRVPAKKST
jgi:hypothetical protein